MLFTCFYILILSMSYFNAHYVKCNINQTCDIHMQYLRYTHVYMNHYFVFSLQFNYCVYSNYKARAFTLMIIFVYDFTLHVLITSLDVVFIKTCVYTCTTTEPHLLIICLCYVAHLYPLDVLVQPSFDVSCILTCIPYFCTCFHKNEFIFMYMSILSKILDIYVYRRVTYFSCNILLWTHLYLGYIYVYSCLDKTYICLEICFVLM